MHDLGGRAGFGPVPAGDGVVFHAPWERRVFPLANLAQGIAGSNADAFRHAIERIPAGDYFRLGYSGRWLRATETMLVEGGVVPAGAVDARIAGRPVAGEARRTTDAAPPATRGARRTVEEPPRFAPGDRVRVSAPEGPGHTRRPAYVQGRTGTVLTDRGGWVLPDAHAHGRGDCPSRVYTVRFAATDLWPDAEPGGAVMVDLFEPYLEPA